MMALSLWRPWSVPILWPVPSDPTDPQPKRVENRQRWREGTPALAVARRLVGERFLLHASAGHGTKADFAGACEMIVGNLGPRVVPHLVKPNRARVAWPPAESLPRMALVGSAKLSAVVWTAFRGHRWARRLSVERDACLLCGESGDTRQNSTCPKADPWAMMGIGLVLAEVEPLAAPISFAGHQGWFRVPDDLPSLQTKGRP